MAEDAGLSTPARTLRSELLRGGSGVFALQIASAVLSVGSAVLFARVLGAEEYGAYAFALATATLLVIPTNLGLPALAVREVAVLSARRDWAVLRGFVGWSARLVAGVATSVAVVAVAVVAGFGVGPDEARPALVVACALVPLAALGQLGAGVLRGLRHVSLGHLFETVSRPALAVVLFVAAYVAARESLDARWAVGAQVGAAAVTLALVGRAALRRMPSARGRPPPSLDRRSWVAAAMPMALIGAAHLVILNVDVVMVGAFEGAQAAGIYRVATRGAQAVVLVLVAANTVLQPVVASLHARGEIDRLQRVLTRSVRLIAAVSLPATAVLVGFGGPILRAVFGQDFEAGDAALAILALGQLVNALVGSAGVVLTMTGHERDAARAVIIGALVNVALNAFLIPAFGIEGAALATAASIVTWNVLLVRRSVAALGLDPTVVGTLARRSDAAT